MGEFRFVIDTHKRLSMGRIGKYLVGLEKLLGVPTHLISIEQTQNAEWPEGKSASPKERIMPETTPNDQPARGKQP